MGFALSMFGGPVSAGISSEESILIRAFRRASIELRLLLE
jgi:hypothetical protein